MRDKVLGKLDRPVFQIQGLQLVPLRDKTVGILTALFRGEAPRLHGAVTPGQQDFPWLETTRRQGYNLESLLRGGQRLGLTRQQLSPQAIADEIWKNHFPYSRRSDFENNVTRSVLPCCAFTSGKIPLRRVPRPVVPRLAQKGKLVLFSIVICYHESTLFLIAFPNFAAQGSSALTSVRVKEFRHPGLIYQHPLAPRSRGYESDPYGNSSLQRRDEQSYQIRGRRHRL